MVAASHSVCLLTAPIAQHGQPHQHSRKTYITPANPVLTVPHLALQSERQNQEGSQPQPAHGPAAGAEPGDGRGRGLSLRDTDLRPSAAPRQRHGLLSRDPADPRTGRGRAEGKGKGTWRSQPADSRKNRARSSSAPVTATNSLSASSLSAILPRCSAQTPPGCPAPPRVRRQTRPAGNTGATLGARPAHSGPCRPGGGTAPPE